MIAAATLALLFFHTTICFASPSQLSFSEPTNTTTFTIPEAANAGYMLTRVAAQEPNNNNNNKVYSYLIIGTIGIDSRQLYLTSTTTTNTSVGVVLNASALMLGGPGYTFRVVVRASDGSLSGLLELTFVVENVTMPYFVDSTGMRADTITLTPPRNTALGSTLGQPRVFYSHNTSSTVLNYTLAQPTMPNLAVSSTTGELTLAVSLQTVEMISDDAMTVTDMAATSLFSTARLVVAPTSYYVRASFSLCGVAIASINTSAATAAVVQALKGAISGLDTLRVISAYSYTSFDGQCVGSNIQLQLYCSALPCTAEINAMDQVSSAFSQITVSQPSLTNLTTLVAAHALDPPALMPTPSYQRCPVVTAPSHNVVIGSGGAAQTVASIANLVGADYDNSPLTLLICENNNSLSNAQWFSTSIPDGVQHLITGGGYLQADRCMYLPPTSTLDFKSISPGTNFHGAAFLTAKISKVSVPSSSISSSSISSVDYTLLNTTTFLTYGAYSADSVLVATIVFPSALSAPYIAGNASTVFGLPPLNIQQGGYANIGSMISAIVIDGEVPLDTDLTNNLVGIDPQLLQALPQSQRDAYAQQVQHLNDIALKRSVLLSSGGSVGVAIIASSTTSTVQGIWQYSPSSAKGYWLNLDSLGALTTSKALLLSYDTLIRFVPSANFSGTATLTALLWDGCEGVEGTLVDTTKFTGSFSITTLTISQTVTHINTRPFIKNSGPGTVPISFYAMPVIPYNYTETNQYVTVFVLNEALSSLTSGGRLSTFLSMISMIVQANAELVRLEAIGNSSSQISIKATNLSAIYLPLLASEVILRYSAASVLTTSPQFPFSVTNTFVMNFTVNAVNGYPSTPIANTGSRVSSIASAIAADVDPSDVLGLAISHVPVASPTSGTWLYRTSSSATWQSIPNVVSTRNAFLMPSSWEIKFSPNEQYLGVSAIEAFVWDQTFYPAGVLTDPISDSLTSPFSLLSVTVTVNRAGCDGVANSLMALNGCGACVLQSSIANNNNNNNNGGGGNCTLQGATMCSVGVIDGCGVCGGNTSTCAGCNNIPFSAMVADNCGTCNGRYVSKDCNGDCFGTAFVDSCGNCVGGNTLRIPNFAMDCQGTCRGSAVMDDCQQCVLGATGRLFNYAMDCRGTCFGLFARDSCGICKSPSSNYTARDCNGACFGPAVVDDCGTCVPSAQSPLFNRKKDSCGVCNGTNSTCLGCDSVPNSGKIVDECGVCGGNSACLFLTSATPNGASISGGANISVFGSGFVASINSVCKFRIIINSATTLLFSPLVVADRAHAYCISPVTAVMGVFTLAVTMDGVSNTGSVPFTMYNPNTFALATISISEATTNTSGQVIGFTGSNFIQTNFPACFFPEYSGNTKYAAVYVNASMITCTIPTIASSMVVRPSVSINGLYSEALQSPTSVTLYARAAVVSSATFTPDFMGVIVSWDIAINTSVFADGSATACAQIFSSATVSSLLRDSVCKFLSYNELYISLSSTAQVFLGTQLTIRPAAVYVYGETYSRACIGVVSVGMGSSAINKIVPTAIISTSSLMITDCGGNFTVSGIYSFGSGYAPLRYYFRVLSDAVSSSTSALEAAIASGNNVESSISVSPSLFTAGVRYFFLLTVVNFLNQWSTSAVSMPVTKYSAVASATYHIEGAPLKHYGQNTLALSPNIPIASAISNLPCYFSVGSSGSGIGSGSESFSWTIDQCLDATCTSIKFLSRTSPILSGANSTADTTFLSLFTANLFTNSNTTTTTTTSSSSNNNNTNNNSNTSIGKYKLQQFSHNPLDNSLMLQSSVILDTTSYSPLLLASQQQPQCSIIGGNRDVAQASSLTLSLSESIAQAVPLSTHTVQWSCQRTDGAPCFVGQQQSTILNTSSGPLLVVAPNTLQTGMAIFTASIMTKGTSSSSSLLLSTATLSCSVWVNIVGQLPAVNIFIRPLPLADPVRWDQPALIQAWIAPAPSCTSYQWVCANTKSRFCFVPLLATASGNISATAPFSPAHLSIPARQLIPGLTFSFALVATCGGGSSASSTVRAVINVPVASAPRVGHLFVSNGSSVSPIDATASAPPVYGLELFTNFTFRASNWVDSSSTAQPLRYALAISLDSGNTTSYISPFTTSTTIQTWLPAGLPALGYVVSVTLVAENIYGSQTNLTRQVVVMPFRFYNTSAGQIQFSLYSATLLHYSDYVGLLPYCASLAVARQFTAMTVSLCYSILRSATTNASALYFTQPDFMPVYLTIFQGINAFTLLSISPVVNIDVNLMYNTLFGQTVSSSSSVAAAAAAATASSSQSINMLSNRYATNALLAAQIAGTTVRGFSLSSITQAVLAMGQAYCNAPTALQITTTLPGLSFFGSFSPISVLLTCATTTTTTCGIVPARIVQQVASSSCSSTSTFGCSNACTFASQITLPANASAYTVGSEFFQPVTDVVMFAKQTEAVAIVVEFKVLSVPVAAMRCCQYYSSPNGWNCTNSGSPPQTPIVSPSRITWNNQQYYTLNCSYYTSPMSGIAAYGVFTLTTISTVQSSTMQSTLTTTTITTALVTTSAISHTSTGTQTNTRITTITTARVTTAGAGPTTTTTSTTASVLPSITMSGSSNERNNLVAWILVPLAALVMFGLVVFFIRRWKRAVSKVGATSSPTPEGNNAGGVVNSTLHPSYTKVTVVTKEGKMHELPDFHLPITARLSDARQALKSSLPSGVQVYFLMPSKEAVSLLLERSTTVGEVMQGGTIMIRDVTGMPNTNRQFCVCGSVADYECSRCEGQGYCSEACQRKSWPTHMRTCIPLPRRPQPVSTQQVGRTQATPIRPLVFISNHQNLDSSSESEVDDTDVAKLSMRATGGSTGLGVGTKNNTTAATTAAASNTTTGTGTGTGIGIGATTQSFTSIANLPKPVQASPPPILPVVGMHPSRGGSLSPNIRKPNLADMRMNPSHTHTFADSDDEEEKDNRVHNDS